MKSAEIRQQFLDFFARHAHQKVASSPLVPGNDPTLLFTNAGMVQFKDVFLGLDKRPYVRAASSQRCVRAGGKHNDLENVGYTARHHTFFEMLGNFSFGDYFKRDAIHFAWDFLTGVLKLPQDKLWITVYAEDDEAANIWMQEIGIPAERVARIATSDNFWSMGDTGPCGPCSEIFYDHGPGIFGGPPGTPDADGDRYIEIWNLVFMQFNRDEAGVLHPLPKPSVDTGMGLERISAVMQGVHNNYDIDLFQDLISAAVRETGAADRDSASLKVIADHIRACSFMIVDGVIPSSEGRGYVLRRIIRRAIRHGYKLGQKRPFFYKLVGDLARVMGDAYPELREEAPRVAKVLAQEEERFAETLEHGMEMLEKALANNAQMLDGDTVFRLYDTFGFPVDLTGDIARERGFVLDLPGYEKAMEEQRLRSQKESKFTMATGMSYDGPQTEFFGYGSLLLDDARVVAVYVDGTPVNTAEAGTRAVVVLDRTPFYAESGGQVGDCGELTSPHGGFAVEDTQKIQANVFGQHGVVQSGHITVGNVVHARVNARARTLTANNHSATHLLHAALRRVLGKHVTQKGSLVEPERLRFDFSHPEPMTGEQIAEVERLVNAEIRRNVQVETRELAYDDAIKAGAMALFGEKYGDSVRVVGMADFSTELCGGTHVDRSGDIGVFKVTTETGIAAGVRRIEGATGEGALLVIQAQQRELELAASVLKAQPQEVGVKLQQMMDNVRALEKELARLKSKMASAAGKDLTQQAVDVAGVKLLAAVLDQADAKALRETVDSLRDQLKSCIVVLGSVADGKVTLIAGVTSDLTSRVKAGDLVGHLAQQVGGKGGGRPDMAQGGGTQPEKLPAAIAGAAAWVESRLA